MPKTESISDVNTKEFGEPHKFDPEFRGPVRRRSCTDVICLSTFVVFLVGWIGLAVIALARGSPERLIYPTDSLGRVCGRDPDVIDRPFLFFFDLTRCASPKVPFTGCPTHQMCVKECPKSDWFFGVNQTQNKAEMYCKEDADLTKSPLQLILDQSCAPYYVKSKPIAHRCIPQSLYRYKDPLLKTIVSSTNSSSGGGGFEAVLLGLKYVGRFVRLQEVTEGVVKDVSRLWPFVLAGCIIAMVISFLWILLLRLVAAVMVWLSLFLFTGLCGFSAYYTLNKYLKIRSNFNSTHSSMTEMEFAKGFSKVADLETTWLVFFILTLSIFLICLVVLIFLRKRVSLAIALINEASKAVGSMMSTLFFPLIPYLMHLVFLVIFCVVALCLASTGSPDYRVVCNGDCSCAAPFKENDTCDPSSFRTPDCRSVVTRCQFHSYEPHSVLRNLHIFNLFALFWTMCFVSAFCEMVLAGAFSSWYWAFDKSKDIPTAPVFSSMGRTFRYHLGTLAFGSLIIAIVRMIRMIFEYIDYKLKKHADYKIVKVFMCLCRCCLWCLEKFLRFVNRNAYIYCAIYGTNFCTSARRAFALIMRNVVRVVVLDKVTDFLLLIGKLVVTGGMAVLSFFFFSGEIMDIRGYVPEMNYYLTPVILISVATFFISSAFFDVYNMAVDTLFFCFLEDSERNDGSAEKPFYMGKDLRKILNKFNHEEQS